jgi:hypothetical protein
VEDDHINGPRYDEDVVQNIADPLVNGNTAILIKDATLDDLLLCPLGKS